MPIADHVRNPDADQARHRFLAVNTMKAALIDL
jgi:hypothetical protein